MKINKDFDTVKLVSEGKHTLSNEFNNMSTDEQKKPLREAIKAQKASSPF